MHMPPGVAGTLPDSGFFKGYRLGPGVACALNKADVTDDSDVSHDADMGLHHCHQAGAGATTKLKVELVKRHSLDQVATGFGLKGGEGGVAELLIDSPVLAGDGFEQLLVEL